MTNPRRKGSLPPTVPRLVPQRRLGRIGPSRPGASVQNPAWLTVRRITASVSRGGSVDSQHLGDDDEGDHDEVHYSEDAYRNAVKPTTQVAGREIFGQVGRSGKKVLHNVI